jgi:asparagine synthetase B (glutamine-hydrolysing)
MNIGANSRPENVSASYNSNFENADFSIFVFGAIFFRGCSCSKETISRIAELMREQDFADIVQQLHGVFGIFLFDKRLDRWLIANDNAGLYRIYYDPSCVCTSLLEFVRDRALGREALSKQDAISFIQHGAVFGDRTIISGVSKLTSDRYLEVTFPHVGQARVSAQPRSVRSKPAEAMEVAARHYEDLARYLAGTAVAVDATGGFDTRVNVCMLDHFGLEFDLSISSGRDSADTRIAREIAQMLERRFYVYGHELADIENDLRQSFEESDGQIDLRRFHRPWQAMKGKLADAFKFTVHGGGGEHFGDFFYLQDWPFYNLRPLNFQRFYEWRMAPVMFPSAMIHPRARAEFAASEGHVMELLSAHATPKAHESYNRAAYFVRAPEFFGQVFSCYINNGLNVLAPFLDREMVEAAFRRSAWAGFFEMWHRRMLKRYNPRLAALSTDAGYSATIEFRHLARDLVLFLSSLSLRAINKAGQRLLGRSLFHKVGAFAADSEGYEANLRCSPTFHNSLHHLKKLEIIGHETGPADIRFIHIGRILTVGMWIEKLVQNET